MMRNGCARIWRHAASQYRRRWGRIALGNKSFTVKDPDRHIIEIVEYQPDSRTSKTAGSHMPASRIADRAIHVGILVGDLEAATKFYDAVLGFERVLAWQRRQGRRR